MATGLHLRTDFNPQLRGHDENAAKLLGTIKTCITEREGEDLRKQVRDSEVVRGCRTFLHRKHVVFNPDGSVPDPGCVAATFNVMPPAWAHGTA